ncbi:hypothetical protein EB796_006554 [Bugula neritina]|uniref:Uncharacterized protein n=1 Tax=Bugula neritina TaxID=10212 RepID=A0A7J7KBC2_BUGNE|nr:hypothetical protein EB796_006554 [Bugula neritina]
MTSVRHVQSQGKCAKLPIESSSGKKDYWAGTWKYFQDQERSIIIENNGDIKGDNDFSGGVCEDLVITKEHSATSAFVHGHLIYRIGTCFGCLILQQRTPNVIEMKSSTCTGFTAEEAKRQCTTNAIGAFVQLFRGNRLDVNCKNTFEGAFQFHYERADNEGICNNPENRILACQSPGSSFKDNFVVKQTFSKCQGNAASVDSTKQWWCLGSWKDPNDPTKTYSALWDNSEVLFDKQVRCLLTRTNQQLLDNQLRYTMSTTPNCNELQTEYEGPWRFLYQPALTNQQVELLQPACMLPQNFSGTWFTSSEFDSHVTINATHIQFNTKYTTFTSVDTFYSCQQTRDTRFLMKQVTQGRCEVDYVCFEFLPRHQNIIRFRMGKPYRVDQSMTETEESRQQMFKLACSWSAFTVSRTENLNYVYQTFILNPPAPVECPIGGIYNFTQIGEQDFKYRTKIRGVTERPRVAYQCDNVESEFKVCSVNPKTINLDTERCATVDHVGRPIGEYDEPDNYLQCVGYWQENQLSYLVTYDTEDSVAIFRCWVYERLGWKDIRMSRALRAACGPNQTPRSYSEAEGASLRLDLHENEREFDDCPQKFLDGRDSYMRASTVYILSASTKSVVNTYLLIMLITLSAVTKILLA